MHAGRSPGQRAGLSRGAVLAAARDLLADGGVEALALRALARRLSVAPNALYSHVASKTALVDELLDDLLGTLAPPAEDAPDPVAALAGLLHDTYDVLTAHPDLVPLYLARQGARGPYAVRLGEVMDVLLVRAGIDAAAAPAARRVLIVHALGSAAFATTGSPAVDAERPLPAEESRRTFATSLQWLLAGIVQGGPA